MNRILKFEIEFPKYEAPHHEGRYDGIVDTCKSCYFEADHSKRRMRNMYVRALRLVLVGGVGGWCWWLVLVVGVGGWCWWLVLVSGVGGLCWWVVLVGGVGGLCWCVVENINWLVGGW